MLGSADLIAFVPTREPARAREFYENTLGLEFISEDPFAVVFNAHGTRLRIANVSGVTSSRSPRRKSPWRSRPQMSQVVKSLHGSCLNKRFIIDGAASEPY